MQIYANYMQCGQMSIQQLRLHHKQQVKVKIHTLTWYDLFENAKSIRRFHYKSA